MVNGEEYGQPDRRRMEQCHHSGFPLGVPLGGSDVRCRNDYPLVTDQLEETLPVMVRQDAAMVDGDGRLHRYRGHLSVRHR